MPTRAEPMPSFVPTLVPSTDAVREQRFLFTLADDRRKGLHLLTLDDIAASAVGLGAPDAGGPLSPLETAIVERCGIASTGVEDLREAIIAGEDPLGDALNRVRSASDRRSSGAFYTPQTIVKAMVDWVVVRSPERTVDAGCGSGRFAVEVCRRIPDAEVMAVDIDPVSTLVCRANLTVVSATRASVLNQDFLALKLEPIKGLTAFISNPPYVRHHSLSAEHKALAKTLAASLGYKLSGLAGLHIHFVMGSIALSRQGDIGCFITSAEWLDVGYGKSLRELSLNGGGLRTLHLIDRGSMPFDDVMTTALISCFEVGSNETSIRVKAGVRGDVIKTLEGGSAFPTSRLRPSKRWSQYLTHRNPSKASLVTTLGDLVRVSRGAVTGANKFFILDRSEALDLGIEDYVTPVLQRAEEVLEANGTVRDNGKRRVLLVAPTDLADAERLRNYIKRGEKLDIDKGYVCRHRTPWWRIAAQKPPIVATYMARQAPAFACNPDGLAIVNVIHGFYPKVEMTPDQIGGLVNYLNEMKQSFRGMGRTYQGGLEKFEPKEMEALPIPDLASLTPTRSV